MFGGEGKTLLGCLNLGIPEDLIREGGFKECGWFIKRWRSSSRLRISEWRGDVECRGHLETRFEKLLRERFDFR